MSNLSELLDPTTLALIRRGAARQRVLNRDALLAANPKTAEEAFAAMQKAQGIDSILAQVEADPVRFFEEE
jgi:hypothetical protein